MSDDAPDDVLDYDQVRTRMQDGDVILFRGSILTSQIIERVSSGVYSHAALALWWDERLMLCQAGGKGVEALPMRIALRVYEGAVDWYRLRPSGRARVDLKALIGEAKTDLGMPYSHTNLFAEGAHVLMGTALPEEEARPTGLVCSEYVARCYRKAGLPLADKTDLDTSPTDIATCDALELMGTIVVHNAVAPTAPRV